MMPEKRHNPLKSGLRSLRVIFPRKDIWVAKRHMKKCSTSLITREMQIKSIMKYHLTCGRISSGAQNGCY